VGNHSPYKLGLVLSGGGARGAYEAGVAKYLSERELEPDAYAGASVGALNGAILSSSPFIQKGAERLEAIWRSVTNEQMLQINYQMISLGVFYTAFQKVAPTPTIMAMNRFISSMNYADNMWTYLNLLRRSPLKSQAQGMLKNDGIKDLIGSNITNSDLDKGKPLWISLYESKGDIMDVIDYFIAAKMGGKDTRESEYKKLQSLQYEDRVNALLASAALPLAYESHVIDGIEYRDGGIGQAASSKGNTPLEPLRREGCTHAIVVHLTHSSSWDRYEYDDMTVIEVRPQKPLYSEGEMKSLMNFNQEKVSYLIQRGYEDAKRCVGNVLHWIDKIYNSEQAEASMKESLNRLDSDDFMEEIQKLKRK